jgi:hypothetical protein
MRFQRKGYIYLAFIAMSLIACLMFTNFYTYLQNRGANFCTTDDDVYQAIKVNLPSWLNYFPTFSPVLTFTVQSGDSYRVDASLWKNKDDPPILFVVTDRGWQEPYGNQGYWYSKSDKAFIDTRYKFDQLDDDIYCYRLKPPKS